MALLLAGTLASSAEVTVFGWWHLDSSQPINDSSGNGRTFGSAYSTHPATGGAVAALPVDNGAGGPLNGTGYTSMQCVQFGVGVGGKRQSAMWGGFANTLVMNYGIEIWVMPQDNGIAGGTGGWIFSSGQNGGVALRINAPSGEPSYIDAFVLGPGTAIGSPALIDTNRWTHLAIVNDNGALTFYTNGVACGASLPTGATAPAGDCYIGTPGDNQAFYGYLDEARMFSFAPGAFAIGDLLLRAPGPNIVRQPQNAEVWEGGAAPFSVIASFDNAITYQWRRGGTTIAGATSSQYVLPTVAAGDNGANFDCILTVGTLSTTSSVATLTVAAVNSANVSAYRSAVNGEASLVGYFPVDNSTGPTLTNTKDAAHNGSLELGAFYDGRTTRAFGQRAVGFNGDGEVQIPNNPAFEFPTGNGTIEAIVYLSRSTPDNPVIFSQGYDEAAAYYLVGVDKTGLGLVYANEGVGALNWSVAPTLVGRKAHVAFVFEGGVNVTAYVDGQSLGTKTHTGLGSSLGGSGWIGAVGNLATSNRWAGAIDELAIYSTALAPATIQTHYGKYFYGTNTAAPVIASQSPSKTLLAGGSPVLLVQASGTPPLSYQWSSNSVVIPGATSASLTLANATVSYSASYTVTIQNPYGTTNGAPIILSFVAPPTGYATRAMADHPAAFYRLNETSGTTAVDSAGFSDGAYSASGVTLSTAGLPNDTATAVGLNGSSGRAVVPLTPVLNPNGPFTIEFWAKPNAYTPFANWSVPLSSMDRPGRTGGYEFYMGGNYNGFEFHTAAAGGYNMLTGDGTTAPAGQWAHVVGIHSNNVIWCYVNGQAANPDATDNNVAEGTAGFAANVVKHFYIGSRSDDVRYFNGTLANVAFYNYPLTETQISNHWSFSWVPAAITTPPAGVTTNEWGTITLSAVASGVPNTYKWQKAGVDLVETTNPDGTPHYPNGVTSSTLVISQSHPADSGQYRLVVLNPVGGATTPAVTVTVTADTAKPAIASFEILGTPNPSGPTPFVAKITFTERVDINTASVLGAYAFSGGMTPATVTLSADSMVAYVTTTTGFTAGQKYTVAATGVLDQAQTPNTSDTTPAVAWAPVLTSGVLLWDYYINITPQSVSSLLNSPYYPSAPYTNLITTLFDSTQITGGDLNNQPAFSGIGENYGASLSGWITPTVTTNYYFFLTSDDASQLWLSTDATAANAVLIAEETDCCDGFLEPGTDPATSVAIPLTAGQSYFVRALQTEGGGGDYVKVAWRMEFDPTASTNLVPIASTYLKAYAAVPAPRFNPPVLAGNQITISWTGGGTLLESVDMGAWTPVAGNPASPYTVAASAGKKFYRISRQ
jgi:hypothetical protein